METLNIRRYRPGEEEEIWEIVFQAQRVSNARDYHPTLIDRWAPSDKDMGEWRERLAKKQSFVAIVNAERPVGLAEIEESGFIDYFYVHPDFQGQGIGKALMSRIEEEAHNFGVSRIYAKVSVTARTFFEARGFLVTEEHHNVILGLPAPNFSMEKGLR